MMSAKKNNTEMNADVLIAGGGMAGLTLGILLGQAGVRVVIAEAAKPPAPKDIKPGTRTVALFGGSINILKAAGIWDKLAPASARMEVMRVIDDSQAGQSAPVPLSFAAAEIGCGEFGYNIPNHALYPALLQRVATLDSVSFLTEAGLVSYQTDAAGISAKLKDGTSVRAPLLIGADGRHSVVREIAGLPHRLHDYGQQAMTCVIEHETPHNNVSTEFHRSGGPFALVPLPVENGKNLSSVVWVERDADAARLIDLPAARYQDELQARTNDILGAVKLIRGPEIWPLQWSIARKLVARRVAILAESAHTFTPLGAQGLNLSLRDIAALAETIIDAARMGQDMGSDTILQRYERRRRLDVLTRVAGVNSFNKLISNDFAPLSLLRRTGLKTLDRLPPLKKLAMRQGLATPLDQGRLAKGQVL